MQINFTAEEEFQLLTHFRNIPSTKTRQSILQLSQEVSKISKGAKQFLSIITHH